MKKAIRFLGLAMFCLCFVFAANAQDNNSAKQSENDKPLKIIKKSPANTDGKCLSSGGTVSLRVTFKNDAKIGDVEIVKSSGCQTFDENAVRAAKKIKFEPAIKNGETVTVSKVVQFNFRKY